MLSISRGHYTKAGYKLEPYYTKSMPAYAPLKSNDPNLSTEARNCIDVLSVQCGGEKVFYIDNNHG